MDVKYLLKRKDIPLITIMIAVVNILVFIYMDFTGNTLDAGYLYQHGAMDVPSVLEDGEWYRVLTGMFMHSGFEHLANNMVMLIASGYVIENVYGRWKYLISYFICGIVATAFSAGYEIYKDEYAIGVGASGAIMGIFGIYVVMTMKEWKNIGRNDTSKLFVLIALMVFGNMQEGVDWMAHLGGALCGMILGFLLYHPRKRTTSEIYDPYQEM